MREAAAAAGVLMAGENALPCFSPGHVDTVALERIVYNTQAWAPPLQACFADRLPAHSCISAALMSGLGHLT